MFNDALVDERQEWHWLALTLRQTLRGDILHIRGDPRSPQAGAATDLRAARLTPGARMVSRMSSINWLRGGQYDFRGCSARDTWRKSVLLLE
jgi:hypothetical protein